MNVGAIILAGGKSSRMGQDKGLMLLNNKPMIAHLLATVKNITNDIIIVSNSTEYQQFGIEVREDLIKDAGPLAGIYTGLNFSKHTNNIVLSCDVPFVSRNLLTFLIENSHQYDVTIPENSEKTHQVIGVYNKSCIPIFKAELENNQRKIKLALSKVNLHIVDANKFSQREFMNINTPNELNEAR